MNPLRSISSRVLTFAVLLTAAGIFMGMLVLLTWKAKSEAASGPATSVSMHSVQVGKLTRSYALYLPPRLPANAPLVIVLHGSGENAQSIRQATGYEFESLALAHSFAVAYPNGYQGNWNDCRAADTFSARTEHVNDVAFISAMITQLHTRTKINPNRVFVAGYSNGGQMAYRLALELPSQIAGIATIAANLPASSNSVCTPSGRPIPVLTISGTKDPISPYNGGVESIFGHQSRGKVLSARATVHYFTTLDGQTGAPQVTRLPHLKVSGTTSVIATDYLTPGHPEVEAYTVINGGHVIDAKRTFWPRALGLTTDDLDAPSAIWNFFSRQPSLS